MERISRRKRMYVSPKMKVVRVGSVSVLAASATSVEMAKDQEVDFFDSKGFCGGIVDDDTPTAETPAAE